MEVQQMSRRIFRYLAGTAVVLCAIFGLLAAIVMASDPATLGSERSRSLLLGIAASALFVSLGAVWFVARSFAMPIDKLTAALERLAHGDYDAPPLTSGTDGPEELVGAFGETQEQLKASVITRDYLDRLLSSIRDAIIVIDPDEEIVRVNAAAASLLDYSDDELIGEPLTAVVDTELQEPDEDESSAKPIDGVFLRRDGSPIAVSYTISDVRNDRGE